MKDLRKAVIKDNIKTYLLLLILFLLVTFISDFAISKLFALDREVLKISLFDSVIAITIVPLIETYIFQKLPIDAAIKQNYKNLNLVLIVTGLVFAIYHFETLPVTISLLISGVFLSYIYYRLKILDFYPFIGTTIAHALLNAIIIACTII